MAPIAPEFLLLAEQLAKEACAFLGQKRAAGFEAKGDGSPVTELDRAVELRLRQIINREQPDHGIVGEEFGPENADRDWVWTLDPIDGTRQFAAGLPNFGTLIALGYQQTPLVGIIAHPWTNMICMGVAGQGTKINNQVVQPTTATDLTSVIACLSDPDAFDARTRAGFEALRSTSLWNVYDGGCLGYAALVEGKIGVALNGPNLEPFDIAALIPVVQAAGGVITDWQGRALNARSSGAILATANPRLHEQALAMLN